MKSIIGTSKNTDVSAAVSEATKDMKNPLFFMFVTNYEKLEETAKKLRELYPHTESIGTSGTCYSDGKVHEGGLTVTAFLEGAEVRCGIIRNLSKCPLMDIKEVEENVKKMNPGKEDTVCIEFCTNSEEKLITTLRAGFRDKQIGLVGGTVFGYPENVSGTVACNGVVYENACAYALIKNLTGKVKTYKENIYCKYNENPHIATKVDTEKRELIELDHRPAAEVYCRETGISKEKIVDNVLQNPLGRVVGNNVYITSMYKVSEKGALTNYKIANLNDTIYVLKLLDYKDIVNETAREIAGDVRQVSYIFTVDCAYRHMLFTKEHYISTYVSGRASLGTHMGIVGGGEQFENQHVNQTMVCAVFE